MNTAQRQERLAQIQKTLVWTFIMNVSVCVIKIVLGFSTGVLAIAADGFHSLGDSFSNVIGYMGIRLAKRAPDDRYPYGYDKFESFVTLVMVSLVSVTAYKVFSGGISRFLHPSTFRVDILMLWFVGLSMLINIITIIYEGGTGKKLKSEFLIADSKETKSDLWVSAGVILGVLIINKTGWWRIDGLISIIIGFFILRVIWDIIRSTAKTLADGQIIPPSRVLEVVMKVPGVKFCHAIRSRGREEAFYLDLHLGVAKDLSIERAHDEICHNVKVVLHDIFPGLKNVNVHIEPDNEAGINRLNCIFKRRDPYGHSLETK